MEYCFELIFQLRRLPTGRQANQRMHFKLPTSLRLVVVWAFNPGRRYRLDDDILYPGLLAYALSVLGRKKCSDF
ncbi:hypothetical protein [Maribellus sediminis]|uniref:hypothetical protein n=1 Tax=Maribellus sediminis TaxID=2696285 RepID=UPI001430ACD7|nr:hypothetical protein [Maribellus sediminis]